MRCAIEFSARDVIARLDGLRAYKSQTSSKAAHFLQYLQKKSPFEIKAIQIDGGSEFRKHFKEECERREISIISLKNEVNFLSQVTSTAELAFTMMLTMVRKISPAVHDVYLDNWDCEKFIGKQIQDLNIGVLGMGRLGKIFSSYCNAFDPKLSFYDPFVDKSPFPWIEKIENLEEFRS